MSGRIVLCHTSALAMQGDFVSVYAGVRGEILTGLGPAHANIFAMPEVTAGGFSWVTQGDLSVPAAQLPAASRQKLFTALQTILDDIGWLAGSGTAPVLGAVWPAIKNLPPENYIFAVDGRPVVAAWDHAPAPTPAIDRTADPVPTWLPARPSTMNWIATCLIAAFVIGVFLPVLALWPFACTLSPPVVAQGAAIINANLARAGPSAPPPASPAACVQSLPQAAWNAGRLDMLDGCWHLISDLVMYDAKNQPDPVSNWLICLDNLGNGQQTANFTDGTSCKGPVQAKFNGQHQLLIKDREECDGSSSIIMGQWLCSRASDDQASCIRTDSVGTSTAVFKR